MFNYLRKILLIFTLQVVSLSVFASDFSVTVEIPRMDVAEYHRPYVAMWVAQENNRVAANLSVHYDINMRDEEGEKWLKDLRQWWRRSGRSLDIPVDGITGATKAEGVHDFDFASKLADLPPGQYRLIVEAVREVGGREMVEIPFQWPSQGTQKLSASGENELGEITLLLTP